jgi:PiT family inorganic phosphate transporter
VTFLFLSSGLFLGWSLGANDAANVFGTAVGSRMISFRRAALICALFVILGAVLQGGGTSATLDSLGKVGSLAAAFTLALSAGIAVFLMTRAGLPVSSSQAIVGAIIGWNMYSGTPTDLALLGKIAGSWVASPILGAVFAVGIFLILKQIILRSPIHIFRLDQGIRTALILIGAFGAFSLGANNIANVMGVFMRAVSLPLLKLGPFTLGHEQQLFLLGGLAIAAGVFTYSRKTMDTVGKGLMKMNAEAAIAVVLAHALVLFLFSSVSLQSFLHSLSLPAIPLVPVSSSHTIVGAIVGIGLLYGGRNIRYGMLGKIATGWLLAPIIAGLLCLIALFIVENVFLLSLSSG